jgi:hypothetical protein
MRLRNLRVLSISKTRYNMICNNCKDLVSGKSGNQTIKYVIPIFKYLFISVMIVSGVPAVTKLESFPSSFFTRLSTF